MNDLSCFKNDGSSLWLMSVKFESPLDDWSWPLGEANSLLLVLAEPLIVLLVLLLLLFGVLVLLLLFAVESLLLLLLIN